MMTPRIHLQRRRPALPALALALIFALTSVPAPLGATFADPMARDQFGEAQAWKGEMGAYTVIDFAAEWCGPCWHILPKLQELSDRFPQVKFLVISVDEERGGRDRLASKLDLEIPVLWDEGYAIAEHYAPEAMPATVVLDPSGEVVYRHTGSSERSWRELVRFIEGIAPGAGDTE